MIVLNSDNTSHSFKIIPRVYDLFNVTMELYNEETSITSTEILSKTLVNGYLECSFTKEVQKNSNYRVKIYNNSNDVVYYRGKMFFTNQTDLQNYRITNDYMTL